MPPRQNANLSLGYIRSVAGFSDDVAIVGGGAQISHGQLAETCLALALGLHERGIGQGKTLAVRTADPVIALGSLLATGLVGARWVFAHGNLVGSGRLTIDMVLDDGTLPGEISGPVTQLDQRWFAPRPATWAGRSLPFAGFRSPDDHWMISQTSGTTGTPKLVGLSHRIMVDRIAANSERLDWRGLRMASLFPVSAPVWLTYAVTALLHRGSVRVGSDAGAWFGDGVDFALASPAQSRETLADLQPSGKVSTLQVSGGPASEGLVRSLLGSFQTVWVGYGSTEGFNALSNAKTLGADGQIDSRTVLAPESQVEVVDAGDRVLAAGEEGLVRVRNPYLAPGYLNAPEASAASFRDGWFYPGDLGRWDEGGSFHVTGRSNEQFNLGGIKLNAQLMDFALLGVAGVRDAICFMLPDAAEGQQLRAFLSVEPGADQTEVLFNARLALLALGGVSAVPKRFLFADSLPRNANGKADRRACVRLVEDGKFRRQAKARATGAT